MDVFTRDAFSSVLAILLCLLPFSDCSFLPHICLFYEHINFIYFTFSPPPLFFGGWFDSSSTLSSEERKSNEATLRDNGGGRSAHLDFCFVVAVSFSLGLALYKKVRVCICLLAVAKSRKEIAEELKHSFC